VVGDEVCVHYARGRALAVRRKQARQVFRWINGRDPRQYGFDFGLWMRQVVAELIADRFAIELSLASVGKLLASLGLTPQKPLLRPYERDLEATEAWKRDTYPSIAARIKRRVPKSISGMNPVFAPMWCRARLGASRGRTPIVAVPGIRQSVSAASAVNAKGAFWFATYQSGMSAELFVIMLGQLIRHRKKPLFLILDSQPAHKAKVVQN
jgi:transposase